MRHIITLLLLVALISTITAIPRPQDDDVKKNEIDSDKEVESADKQEVTSTVPMVYVTKTPVSEYPTSGWGQFFIDILKIPLNLVRSMTHLFREAFTGHK